MKNIFRSFERFGLDYILMSGQASVLYGAATFSEDIDIWVAPEAKNLERLLRALAACRAACTNSLRRSGNVSFAPATAFTSRCRRAPFRRIWT